MKIVADWELIAVAEAVRVGTPMAVLCQGMVNLGLPDGGMLAMPAAVAQEAAKALLSVTDTQAGGVSCLACRHALLCSQLGAVRRALTLRDYLHEGGEDEILRAVAGNCQLFEAGNEDVS